MIPTLIDKIVSNDSFELKGLRRLQHLRIVVLQFVLRVEINGLLDYELHSRQIVAHKL